MLKDIIVRELMDHIKSLRLLITFLLLIVMMTAGGVLSLQEYRRQMSDFNENTAEAQETLAKNAQGQAALFRVFSYNWQGPFVYKRPNTLSFVSAGQARNLPNAFSPSAFKIYGPYKKVRSNVFLGHFADFDWVLIFGVILSFAAIILVYDGICGEKEEGTLRLAMANNVSRSLLLFGKYLGGLAALGIPVCLGVLIQLLLMTAGGTGPQGADWVSLLLSLLFTLLYLSCYLILGLLISSVSSTSSTSLVANLLVWALLVVVIPGVSGMAAGDLVRIPTRETAYNQADRAWNEAIERYNREYPELQGASLSGHWSPGEPLERAVVAADAWSQIIEDFRNRQIDQVAMARRVTFISPTAVYAAGLEAIAESGVYHYQKFYRQVRNFKLAQRQFLFDRYPLPNRWFFRYGSADRTAQAEEYESLMKIDVSLNEIPRFEEQRLPLSDNLQASLLYLFLLVIFCAALYAGAHSAFQKYDVR